MPGCLRGRQEGLPAPLRRAHLVLADRLALVPQRNRCSNRAWGGTLEIYYVSISERHVGLTGSSKAQLLTLFQSIVCRPSPSPSQCRNRRFIIPRRDIASGAHDCPSHTLSKQLERNLYESSMAYRGYSCGPRFAATPMDGDGRRLSPMLLPGNPPLALSVEAPEWNSRWKRDPTVG